MKQLNHRRGVRFCLGLTLNLSLLLAVANGAQPKSLRITARAADDVLPLVNTVNLSWVPSPTPGVVEVRIYQGFDQHNWSSLSFSVPVPATNVTMQLMANVTNYFAATAATADGLESDFSNIVAVQGPTISNYSAFVEAESGSLSNLITQSIDGRVGIYTVSEEAGHASFALTLPLTSEYVVWARVIAPDNGSDSWYLTINGETNIFHMGTNYAPDWRWSRFVWPTVLPAGPTAIAWLGREANSVLDGFWISSRTNFTPQTEYSNVVSFAVQILSSTNASGPYQVLTNLPVFALTNPPGSQYFRSKVSIMATNL